MQPEDYPDGDPWYDSLSPKEQRSYDRYQHRMEEEDQRSRTRTEAKAPHRWGRKLNATHYFCLSCWLRGDKTGAHPYAQPPCDPIQRGHGRYE
jgi:hypothetical protein